MNAPSVQPPVLLQLEGAIATLVLNRPTEGNAFNLAMAEQLSEAASRVAADASIRCVILTALGRFFSVGGDIGSFKSAGSDVPQFLTQVTTHLHKAVLELAKMDKPLVVAANGPAAGAGLSLAVLGDIVIATEVAHFSMAYTAIGLTPDGGVSALLPRLIGLRKTQELAFTNRRVTSQEAVAIGLINRVVAAEQLAAEAQATAESLASGAVRAFGSVRRLLHSGYEQPFEVQLELEASAIAAAAGGCEGKEGIAAFLEKRRPDFVSGDLERS